MPQFDFYSFGTQVFSILFGFILFHFFVLNYITIPYARVLKLRQKLINTYLTNVDLKKISNQAVYDSTILYVTKYFWNYKG